MFWFQIENFKTLSPTHDMDSLRTHLHLLVIHANVPLALVILAYSKEALFGLTPFFWLFFACFVDLAIVFGAFLHIYPNPADMTNALYFLRFLSIYAFVLAVLASIANVAVWIYVWNGSKKVDALKRSLKTSTTAEEDNNFDEMLLPGVGGFRDSTVVVAREGAKIVHRIK